MLCCMQINGEENEGLMARFQVQGGHVCLAWRGKQQALVVVLHASILHEHLCTGIAGSTPGHRRQLLLQASPPYSI